MDATQDPITKLLSEPKYWAEHFNHLLPPFPPIVYESPNAGWILLWKKDEKKIPEAYARFRYVTVEELDKWIDAHTACTIEEAGEASDLILLLEFQGAERFVDDGWSSYSYRGEPRLVIFEIGEKLPEEQLIELAQRGYHER